ncbi:MAG: 50S ribosomal protein L13 [Thermicanus sp.]|nr:50S ribosomal protein L13 [Thermicanus sp.]
MRTTYMPHGQEALQNRKWYVIDAEGKTLGRLASEAALILRGKHKPTFTPHLDSGDHVIIINAEKVHLTGKKWTDKLYHFHSQYPGGLKTFTARDMIKNRPVKMVEMAIRGMLPKNRLGRQMFTKLKVYAGTEHPHQAQKPEVWELRG